GISSVKHKLSQEPAPVAIPLAFTMMNIVSAGRVSRAQSLLESWRCRTRKLVHHMGFPTHSSILIPRKSGVLVLSTLQSHVGTSTIVSTTVMARWTGSAHSMTTPDRLLSPPGQAGITGQVWACSTAYLNRAEVCFVSGRDRFSPISPRFFVLIFDCFTTSLRG